MALLMGSPQRARAPGSETVRVAAAPEKRSAATSPRSRAASPTSCQGREIPTASAPRVTAPLPGAGWGAVERDFAAEGTYPLAATRAEGANRPPQVNGKGAATLRLPLL